MPVLAGMDRLKAEVLRTDWRRMSWEAMAIKSFDGGMEVRLPVIESNDGMHFASLPLKIRSRVTFMQSNFGLGGWGELSCPAETLSWEFDR